MSYSQYGSLDTSFEAQQRFEREGLAVVYPKTTELQIDIDSDEQCAQFKRLFGTFVRNSRWPVQIVRDAYSRSGAPKRHVTLDVGQHITPELRIALQAALGSDPMRECLSLCRWYSGDPQPTLFVEKP